MRHAPFTSLVLAAVTALALTACGPTEPTTEAPPVTAEPTVAPTPAPAHAFGDTPGSVLDITTDNTSVTVDSNGTQVLTDDTSVNLTGNTVDIKAADGTTVKIDGNVQIHTPYGK